ncbi:MAG: hypothetical protein O7A98_05705, partial [Acidobacteria bacterium]|nr:hypothetical protein [Acidobacteriota bacterium]
AHLETRWGLAPPGTVAPGGRAAIDLADSPTLLIDEAELVTSPDGPPAGRWWSDPLTFAGAWLLLAATAFRSRLRWLTGLLAAAAVALWAWAALAPVGLIVGLALAVAAAFASLALARRRTAVPWAPWRGLLGAALLLAVAWALQRTELIDLAAHFVISGTAWVARTALFLCSLS